MRFQCPFCSYIITTDESMLGKKSSCPSCNQSIAVPKTNRQEGCVIGDFILQEKLGAGSLATVFKAVQISLGREVALKILSDEYTNAKGILDFLKEARAAAKLNHPNLVQAYAVGEENGTCYLAMDYIKGKTLKDMIRSDEDIPVDKALHIIQQIAEALYYAWEEAEMIHRDVKPDNIMINTEGMAKLTDLGLAMNKSDWHEDMDISGSPSYMSTEQFAGEELDTRSDIYSLGVTLYQILTRKLPFDGSTIRTIAKQHFQDEAIPVNKINKNIPTSVSNLVKKMIAKRPEDRFNDMEDLLKAIWQIRQKTAPSTEMIPNVHTISIKRLEYDIQNEKVQQKQRELEKQRLLEAKVKNQSKSIRFLFKLSIVALLALVVGIGYYVHTTGQQKKESNEFSKKVSNFEKMIETKSISKDDYIELKSIANDLRNEAKMLNLPNVNEFYARIDKTLLTAEKKLLSQKIQQLSTQKNHDKIKSLKAVATRNKKTDEILKQTANKLKDVQTKSIKKVNKLESKLTNLEENQKQLETTSIQKTEALKRLNAKVLRDWKDSLLIKIYANLKNAKFDLAKGFLIIEKQRLKKENDKIKLVWINGISKWLLHLEDSYNILTANGIKPLKKSTSPKYLSASLLLLGKPIAASIASPNDEKLIELSNAVLKDKVKSIQAYSYSQKTKERAKRAANDILRKLQQTNLFDDVKLELQQLLLNL